jgi:hypothetical protein
MIKDKAKASVMAEKKSFRVSSNTTLRWNPEDSPRTFHNGMTEAVFDYRTQRSVVPDKLTDTQKTMTMNAGGKPFARCGVYKDGE